MNLIDGFDGWLFDWFKSWLIDISYLSTRVNESVIDCLLDWLTDLVCDVKAPKWRLNVWLNDWLTDKSFRKIERLAKYLHLNCSLDWWMIDGLKDYCLATSHYWIDWLTVCVPFQFGLGCFICWYLIDWQNDWLIAFASLLLVFDEFFGRSSRAFGSRVQRSCLSSWLFLLVFCHASFLHLLFHWSSSFASIFTSFFCVLFALLLFMHLQQLLKRVPNTQ